MIEDQAKNLIEELESEGEKDMVRDWLKEITKNKAILSLKETPGMNMFLEALKDKVDRLTSSLAKEECLNDMGKRIYDQREVYLNVLDVFERSKSDNEALEEKIKENL